jgi:hypothetical protein
MHFALSSIFWSWLRDVYATFWPSEVLHKCLRNYTDAYYYYYYGATALFIGPWPLFQFLYLTQLRSYLNEKVAAPI